MTSQTRWPPIPPKCTKMTITLQVCVIETRQLALHPCFEAWEIQLNTFWHDLTATLSWLTIWPPIWLPRPSNFTKMTITLQVCVIETRKWALHSSCEAWGIQWKSYGNDLTTTSHWNPIWPPIRLPRHHKSLKMTITHETGLYTRVLRHRESNEMVINMILLRTQTS